MASLIKNSRWRDEIRCETVRCLEKLAFGKEEHSSTSSGLGDRTNCSLTMNTQYGLPDRLGFTRTAYQANTLQQIWDLAASQSLQRLLVLLDSGVDWGNDLVSFLLDSQDADAPTVRYHACNRCGHRVYDSRELEPLVAHHVVRQVLSAGVRYGRLDLLVAPQVLSKTPAADQCRLKLMTELRHNRILEMESYRTRLDIQCCGDVMSPMPWHPLRTLRTS